MNKFWIGALVVALAVAGVALWQLDVFGGKASPPVDPAGDRPSPANGGAEPGGLRGGMRGPAREEPKDEPKPVEFPIASPLRVLFVLDRVMQWPQYLGMVLKSHPQVAYTYYSVRPQPNEQPLVTSGQEAVVDEPTGSWFAQQEFDVLVVGGCDPGEIGDDFWQAVADRVRAGKLGLLVWPDLPPTPIGEPQGAKVHPMLTHAVFRTLLPLEEAAPLEGEPKPGGGPASIPGIFSVEARFHVTDAGVTHPATRIVPFPQWSRRMWAEGASPSGTWGSKFVYPVTKLRPGAVTLVNAVPDKGRPIPMLVQGPLEGGRVLWFGAHDFGDATYRNMGPSMARWNAIVHNSVVWLAGRAPRE
jgi:hypothetical protein